MREEQTADQVRSVLDDLAQVMDEAGPEQHGDPTPCRDFDVERLQRHVLAYLDSFATSLESPDGSRPDTDDETYGLPDDPGEQVRETARRMVAAARKRDPDAQLASGLTPQMTLQMLLLEYVVHGWDLARALGRPWEPDADAVQAALDFGGMMLLPEYQGEGKPFGLPVPVGDDSRPLERLLAKAGRDPGWPS